jgi:hypothetical protein
MTSKLRGGIARKVLEHTVEMEMEDGTVECVPLVLRRPPTAVITAANEGARQAGEADDSGEPTSQDNGIRLLARMVRPCVYEPGGVLPVYADTADDLQALREAPWFDGVAALCLKHALPSAPKALEDAVGNSEATPTGTSP